MFSSSSSVCSRYGIYFGHTVIFPAGRKTFQYLVLTRCVYLKIIYLFGKFQIFLVVVEPSEKSSSLE